MSRVLLINSVIREFASPNNVPLGILYLSSMLKKFGHQVTVCDMNVLRTIDPDREKWLKQYIDEYDIIGLSGLIVTYKEQRRYLDFIMEHYKDFGKPLLISGGGLATSVPEFTLRNMPELDAVCIGEGEYTIVDIADNGISEKVAGIAFMRDGKLTFTKQREYIKNLDEIPFPDWQALGEYIEIYLKNPIWGASAGNSSKINYVAKRSMNMIVSRGCPHSCSFCYHYVFGRNYRLRSVRNVIDEISTLKELYDIDFVGFVDDNTTANRQWILDFADALEELNIRIHWGGSARVDQVDPFMLRKLRSSGCEWIGFGIESANPDILRAMKKKITPEQAKVAMQMVRDAGIYANATFIAGYPGETIETLRDTARFMRRNNCLNSMFYATPYPGTELYEKCKGKILEVYKDEDAYIKNLGDATEFRINLSEMTASELQWYRSYSMRGVEF